MKRCIKANILLPTNRSMIDHIINGYLDDWYGVIDQTQNSWEVDVERGTPLKPFVDKLRSYLEYQFGECSEVEKYLTDKLAPNIKADTAYKFNVGDSTVYVEYSEYENLNTFIVILE